MKDETRVCDTNITAKLKQRTDSGTSQKRWANKLYKFVAVTLKRSGPWQAAAVAVRIDQLNSNEPYVHSAL